MLCLDKMRTADALCAGKGKEEDVVQEEGGVTLNGRGTDEVQGSSDEVHLCTVSRTSQQGLTLTSYLHAR